MVTPYDGDFVADLKAAIAYPHRIYHREDRTWEVSEAYFDTLMDILDQYFDKVEDMVHKPPARMLTGNLFDEVFKIIPKDYLDRCYKALAMAVHPDHGGTNTQMKQLNDAYERRIKQR